MIKRLFIRLYLIKRLLIILRDVCVKWWADPKSIVLVLQLQEGYSVSKGLREAADLFDKSRERNQRHLKR